MPWTERYALGVEEMDATHREFVALVDALPLVPDEAFPAKFAELREHTRRHFEHEAQLMRSCRFPATGEHEGEHLRVLGELAHLGQRIAGGRLTMARAYAEGMPQWFANHVATMDAALAACLKARAGQ